MECSHPPPLREDQLSAALDDGGDDDVRAHVAACPSCAARLNDARRLEAALRRRLYRADCPSPQRLADYRLGLLGENEAEQAEQHLTGCPRCREEDEELRRFLADAPPPARKVPSARPARPMTWALRGRVVRSVSAVALRGAGGDPLMIEAGPHTIFLDARLEGSHGLRLTGQLLAQPEEPWRVALVEIQQGGAVRFVGPLDAAGGFQCLLPSREPIELRISATGQPVIVVAGLHLTPDHSEDRGH